MMPTATITSGAKRNIQNLATAQQNCWSVKIAGVRKHRSGQKPLSTNKNGAHTAKEMQEKQLRVLLRIDNNILKQSRVPIQSVFRSTSNQCIRNPRARANPGYLMSAAGEVLTARRYLRSIGLDPQIAGNGKTTW